MAIYVKDSIYTIFSVDKGGALGNSKGWHYYLTAHSPRAQHGVGVMDGTEYTYSVTGKFTDTDKTPVVRGKFWIVHCQDRTNLFYSFQPWLIRSKSRSATGRCLCVYGATTSTKPADVSNGTLVDCRSDHDESYNTCKWKITGSTSVAYFQNNQTNSYIQHSSNLYNEDQISTRSSSSNACRWIMTDSAVTSGNGALSYSMTLNANGGIFDNLDGDPDTWTFNVYYGLSTNLARTAPVRTGYTLTGIWTTSSGGTKYFSKQGNYVIPISTATNGNVYFTVPYTTWNGYSMPAWRYHANTTFYAQWTMNSYNISYNLGGGTLSKGYDKVEYDGSSYDYLWNPTTVKYDTRETYTSLGHTKNMYFQVQRPTRPGYIFKGWTITGMDNTTHYYWIGSAQTSTATSWNTSAWSNLSPAMRCLRATAGTVTFTAQWELDTNVWVKVGETWKHGKAWIKVGDTWKLADKFGVNANGTWKDGI